ncbi:TonB-dependent receptor [Methylobacterium tarhaniae]|uniref:TonB-dependent receptor n=1 Tax=Methylobacterium tarhaniae TaxID=1187852 RepID=A0A0J6SGE7_9HYPH|nr:TonB-dependent siderophore receptor [Methylobacterium tarhaniae]KMO32744.1 TonB-dependent receptor [Methylobacterium tarhaniae]
MSRSAIRRRSPLLLALLAGAAPILAAGAAGAQATGDLIALDTITVAGVPPFRETATGPVQGYRATRSATATKTDTALRDTPQTVNVVPREVLVDRQETRLADALFNVSNVQPGGTLQGRSDTFLIRGFRTQSYAIDGVFMNQANTFYPVQRDFADIERIEVLKGPASVLYGRGDPGGVINIVTRQPSPVPTADASIQGGSFGFRRVQGSVSGPVPGVEGLAARLSFASQGDSTFRNLAGRENSRSFVAPAITWNPSPDTRVSFIGEFTRQDTAYDEGLAARNGRVPLDDIARFYGEPFASYNATANFGTLKVEHDFNEHLMIRQVLNAQSGTFDVFAPRAVGLSANGRLVNRRTSGINSAFAAVDSQTELVAKFEWLGLRHTALVGVEYFNGYRRAYTTQGTLASVSFDNPILGVARPGAMGFLSEIKQKNELTGLYAQDQIDLGYGLQLLLGVRYDAGTQFYFNRTAASRTIPPDQELSGTSPRVGLIYRVAEPLALYASYTTSFKPQTDNVLGTSNPPPETGEQVEVGTRFDLSPDLSLTASVFDITRNNVSVTDPANTGFSIITGQQRSKGVEADLAGTILPGWKIIGGVGYTDARITRDTTFAIGNRLGGVPLFSGSVWSTYQFQDGPWRGLGIGAGLTYVGSRFGDIGNTYKVGAYTRVDAAVFYDLNEHARFSLNLRNLTDARYIEQTFNPVNNLPGAPFSVLATITARM